MRDEKRSSRDSFTRSLKRIAKKIDTNNRFEIEFYDDLFRKKRKSVVRVTNLWAFGSWARGALTCGDLDLIAEVSAEKGHLPFSSNIRRVIVKRASDVRLYIGRPEQNESGAPIDDAVLIWSTSNRDWAKNMQAVKADPSAKRFTRKLDIIPLRKRQLGEKIERLEKLVDLKNSGMIDWEWLPFPDAVVEEKNWSDIARNFFQRVQRRGKKTIQVMKYIIDWFETHDPVYAWEFDNYSKVAFVINGNHVNVGQPIVDMRHIDEAFRYSLMLVPHITKRGPNGIWRIKRGSNHSLAKQFHHIKSYFLKYKDYNRPLITSVESGFHRVFTELMLFTKWSVAEIETTEEWYEGENVIVESAEADDLLKLLASVDCVVIDHEPHAITWKGSFCYKKEILEVLEAEQLGVLLKNFGNIK